MILGIDDEMIEQEAPDFTKMSDHEKYTYEKKFPIPYTLQLEYSIDWTGDEQISEVIFERRLQAKDLISLPSEGVKMGHMLALVSKVTGKSQAFLQKLDSIDFFKCTDVISSFLPNSQKTGKES